MPSPLRDLVGTLSADLAVLASLEPQPLQALCKAAYSSLAQATQADDFEQQIAEVAQAANQDEASIRKAVKAIIIVLKECVRSKQTPTQVTETFGRLGASAELSEYLGRLFKRSHDVLSSVALGKTLGLFRLVDMEWKFGVTCGTSEQFKTSKTFLQLKLVLSKGAEMKEVHMELSLLEFYDFLHDMEAAKSALDSMS